MILLALLLAAGTQSHPREHPVTTVEWIDHYDYCLGVNFTQILNARPAGGKREAARRAVTSCWPVRSSATQKIIEHLMRDGGGSDVNERQEITNRLLNIVTQAFAIRAEVSPTDLGPLCAPSYSEDECSAEN